MSVTEYECRLVTRQEITAFIEQWHYSGSINGCIADYSFGLYDNDNLIGAMFYGRLAMANQHKKYTDDPTKITELRRLCCIDDTPKNTESYFIGATLRWLKKNTILEKVVSYADSNYNHTGIIYKASNFVYLGQTACGKVIMYNGKKYHDKAIRTYYNGKLKPFALAIKNALTDGSAVYIKQKPKHIYLYTLRGRK